MELKGENYVSLKAKVLEIGNWHIEEESNIMWNEMSVIIKWVEKRFLENYKRVDWEGKESSWWNGKVNKIMKEIRPHLKPGKKKNDKLF